MARPQANLLSTLQLDFALPAQRDHKLPGRRGVPIEVVVLVRPPELQSGDRHHGRQFRAAALSLQRNLELLDLGLAVSPCIESRDLDWRAALRRRRLPGR